MACREYQTGWTHSTWPKLCSNPMEHGRNHPQVAPEFHHSRHWEPAKATWYDIYQHAANNYYES